MRKFAMQIATEAAKSIVTAMTELIDEAEELP